METTSKNFYRPGTMCIVIAEPKIIGEKVQGDPSAQGPGLE